MNSARRSDGAKCAIPSHFVLLTNPVSSSTQPQGIISNTPQVMRGVRVLPHAKNQRFFPRGPRMCLRLCPTKCPRFAAVLCGDPAVFPQKKKCKTFACSSFCHLVPKLSRCSLIFTPRGWRLPPPVLFCKDEWGFVLSHEPDFHLSLTRFFTPAEKSKIFTRGPRNALRELRTQIGWRKMRYSVASLLTNPVSSSRKPARNRWVRSLKLIVPIKP